MRSPFSLIAALLLAALLGGCISGPKALQRSRVMYNEAIARTQSEQLLLNLVRLRYRDSPLFLEVSSVSTQFNFDGSASVSGIIVEGAGRDSLGLGSTLSYSEKPTVSFAPLQGSDFVERLLTSVTLETIITLSRSGWSIERVLRLCANHMNGIENAASASGPTPALAPPHAEFARAAAQLRALQITGAIEFGLVAGRADLSAPIDADAVGASDLIAAAREGYRFEPQANGEAMVLREGTTSLALDLAPDAAGDAEGLRELLGLSPDARRFEVTAAGGHPHVLPAPGKREQIAVGTRSLMGTLFYLANAVDVPAGHIERGLVTVTRHEDGTVFDWSEVTGDMLRVHSAVWPPLGAAVAVQHRGYWFYIDDSDLNSKSTFALLSQLFALQAGGAKSVAPVLTLPIGG